MAFGVPAIVGAVLVGMAFLSPLGLNSASPSSSSPQTTAARLDPSGSIGSSGSESHPIVGSHDPFGPGSLPGQPPALPAGPRISLPAGIGEPSAAAVPAFPSSAGATGGAAPPLNTISDPRFAEAQRLGADGQVGQSVALLGLIRSTDGRLLAARAQYLIGQAYLRDGDNGAAANAFRAYFHEYPNEADAEPARFGLATALDRSGQTADAVSLYQRYLDLSSDHTLDGYAWLALAKERDARGDPAAAEDYRRAMVEGLPLPDELDAASRVAANLTRGGRPGAAITWYLGLADRYPLDDPIHGQYLVRAADAAAQAGQSALAARLIRDLAGSGRAPADVAAELTRLGALGVPLDELSLGRAFLRSGSYRAAASTFGDYIDRHADGGDLATARFERGQALLGASDYSGAIAQLQTFLDHYPTDPRVGDARALMDQASKALGDGSIGDPTKPSGGAGPRAAFAQGWTAYEALDFASAQSTWSAIRRDFPNDPGSSASLLWLGKLELKAGDSTGALRDLRQAWTVDPGGYYGFRAREIATTVDPAAFPSVASPPNSSPGRAEFVTWLARWTRTSPDDVGRPYLGAPITRTKALDRIRALAALGLDDLATKESRSALDLYWLDGRSLYALADVLSQTGLNGPAMNAANQLLMLSPAPNAYQAPIFLQRLAYPFPYRDLVEAAARRFGIDPLLLLAVIRQESSFDPRAGSWAGAMGLTQFMPSTASLLAPAVGFDAFTTRDLYRPPVAITLGAAFLADLSEQFGGKPYLALAAYNAGAGNLQSWLSDNPHHDFDLLAEEISFPETRDYVRNVYRFYQEYRTLYPELRS